MIQNRLPRPGGKLQATRAVAGLPLGRPSTRTRVPAFRARRNRTPHPLGFTRTVWQISEKEVAGSRLVIRTGICAFTRVPCRRCTRVSTSVTPF